MQFMPVNFKDFAKKVASSMVVVLLAFAMAAGIDRAMAHFYNPAYDQLENVRSHLKLSGRLRGSGLASAGEIAVALISPDGSITNAAADIGPDGSFMLQNVGSIDPEASAFDVIISIKGERDGAVKDLSLHFGGGLSTLEISGKGLSRNKSVSVSLSDEIFSKASLTDWSGAFNTGIIRKQGLLANGKEACVKFGSPQKESEVCFGVSLGVDGYFTLAQFWGGGGGGNLSPFSTWEEPDDCEPAGTTLSVCRPSHIEHWQQMLAENYTRAFMAMTQQLSTLMVQQMEIIGAFMDAKHQLEVQRWIQQKQAEAHSDYHPARQICYYATFSQDLTSLSLLSDYNTEAINSYMFDREMGPGIQPTGETALGTGAPGGENQDRYTRLRQFSQLYCSENNNGEAGLELMCQGVNPNRTNRDINFTEMEARTALDLNFAVPAPTDDETDLLAMSKYLFSHDLLERPDRKDIFDEQILTPREGARHVMNIRSIIAMRGPMRDSFAQIMAMRGAGTGISTQYISAYLENMGMDSEAINEIMGPNPSELGVLNVLMNKMSQNPHFYTETYETDVNVERTRAAMQAIDNLGGRKAFEAALRREMLIATRLELRLRDVQDEINARVQHGIETYEGAANSGAINVPIPIGEETWWNIVTSWFDVSGIVQGISSWIDSFTSDNRPG